MKLKIAVQKKGRLYEDSIQLLKDCGININNSEGQLKASASNFQLEVLYLRNSDIPKYVENGVADLAIVGSNILEELDVEVLIQRKLGFSKCKVALAAPKASAFKSVKDLEGKKIATSYPNTLSKYLKVQKVNAAIHEISGSVEIAPNIGLADAICDIVSTGSTLFKNGLTPIVEMFNSEAVLIQNKAVELEKKSLIEALLFRIDMVLKAKKSKYILMNVPNNAIEEITQLLPVLKSPTILPLQLEGWSSLHSVIEEDQFWEVLSQLKKAGAEGILVVPIEKMVM